MSNIIGFLETAGRDATMRHASTSSRELMRRGQMTAMAESKVISENGTWIDEAISFFVGSDRVL